MDEARLIQEVVREVQRRLAVQNKARRKLAVLGSISSREKKELEEAFCIVPAEESGWEVLLLAEASPELLCGLALGIASTEEGKIASRALLEGKRVCMLDSGLQYKRYKEQAPRTLYLQYQKYEEALLHFGVEKVSHTSDLADRHGSLGSGACADLTSLRLLRESDLIRVKSQGYRNVCLGKDTLITPLAGDYISNHGLCVSRRDEVRDWKSVR